MVVETVSFTDYLLRCHYFVFLFHLQCLKSNITVLVYWKYVIFYGLFFSHIVTYHIVSMFPFSQMSLVLHLQSNNGFVQLFYFSFDIRSGAYVRCTYKINASNAGFFQLFECTQKYGT